VLQPSLLQPGSLHFPLSPSCAVEPPDLSPYKHLGCSRYRVALRLLGLPTGAAAPRGEGFSWA